MNHIVVAQGAQRARAPAAATRYIRYCIARQIKAASQAEQCACTMFVLYYAVIVRAAARPAEPPRTVDRGRSTFWPRPTLAKRATDGTRP